MKEIIDREDRAIPIFYETEALKRKRILEQTDCRKLIMDKGKETQHTCVRKDNN